MTEKILEVNHCEAVCDGGCPFNVDDVYCTASITTHSAGGAASLTELCAPEPAVNHPFPHGCPLLVGPVTVRRANGCSIDSSRRKL